MKCFYAQHAERVGQKCGAKVQFGVKGYFNDGSDLCLCYEHHKWWNRVAMESYPYRRRLLKRSVSKRIQNGV
jgi:hypothetical protein